MSWHASAATVAVLLAVVFIVMAARTGRFGLFYRALIGQLTLSCDGAG